MDETHLPPPPVQPPSPPSVKLGDLNAVKQQIVTRAGITLTAIGLLATASGTIGQLLPDLGDAASRPYPFMVYLASLILPFGAFHAVMALSLSPDLQSELVTRLKTAKGHSDAVSPELQSLFVKNIERSLGYVDVAIGGLWYGCGALVLHAYFTVTTHFNALNAICPFVRNSFHTSISDFAINYYVLFVISVPTIVVLEVRKHFRRRKAKGLKTPALPPVICKVP